MNVISVVYAFRQIATATNITVNKETKSAKERIWEICAL